MRQKLTELFLSAKSKGWFPIAGLIFILALLMLFVSGPVNFFNLGQLAQRKTEQETEASELTSSPTSEPEVEYLSNELLIKIKTPQYQGVVTEGQNPYNTGISSLNKLNQDHQVIKFQRLTKPHNKSKIHDHPIYRWYKITLPGEGKIIQESTDQASKKKELGSTPEAQQIKSILTRYKQDANIEEAEFNHVIRPTRIPDDRYYSTSDFFGHDLPDLWGLKKIQSEGAWDVVVGSGKMIAAVIDSGVDYTHPDLADNIWNNLDEISGNGVDDDGNGFIDDIRGWDFWDEDNDPMDSRTHGTSVAGVIGAAGNNDIGVVGVNWKISIMPIRLTGSFGFEDLAIPAFAYAVDNGAKVLNLSWELLVILILLAMQSIMHTKQVQ